MTVAIFSDTEEVIAEIVEDEPEWVVSVRAHLIKSTEGVIAAGMELIQAKSKVRHGEWIQGLGAIKISERWAQCLMSIAENPAIANTKSTSYLPRGTQALYELSRAPAEDIEAAIESGRINPSTTAKQAKEYVREARGEPPPPPPEPQDEEEQQTNKEAALISGIMLSFQPKVMHLYRDWAKEELIKVLKQAIENLEESLNK